jgi:hypothetical protein
VTPISLLKTLFEKDLFTEGLQPPDLRSRNQPFATVREKGFLNARPRFPSGCHVEPIQPPAAEGSIAFLRTQDDSGHNISPHFVAKHMILAYIE